MTLGLFTKGMITDRGIVVNNYIEIGTPIGIKVSPTVNTNVSVTPSLNINVSVETIKI